MAITTSFKLPSGRSVKRAKQDAKALSKIKKIPLHQALNEISKINGGTDSWCNNLFIVKIIGD